jgi:hypothetical protein
MISSLICIGIYCYFFRLLFMIKIQSLVSRFILFFLQELPVLLQLWISITDTVFPIVGSYILFICLFLLTSYRRFFLLLLLGTVWKLQGKIWGEMSFILSIVVCFWLLLSNGSEDHPTCLNLWLRQSYFCYLALQHWCFSFVERKISFCFSTKPFFVKTNSLLFLFTQPYLISWFFFVVLGSGISFNLITRAVPLWILGLLSSEISIAKSYSITHVC